MQLNFKIIDLIRYCLFTGPLFLMDCTDKKPPIEEAIIHKVKFYGDSLISYKIDTQIEMEKYSFVRFSAIVQTPSREQNKIIDSIQFSKTGDGIWVYK